MKRLLLAISMLLCMALPAQAATSPEVFIGRCPSLPPVKDLACSNGECIGGNKKNVDDFYYKISDMRRSIEKAQKDVKVKQQQDTAKAMQMFSSELKKIAAYDNKKHEIDIVNLKEEADVGGKVEEIYAKYQKQIDALSKSDSSQDPEDASVQLKWQRNCECFAAWRSQVSKSQERIKTLLSYAPNEEIRYEVAMKYLNAALGVQTLPSSKASYTPLIKALQEQLLLMPKM